MPSGCIPGFRHDHLLWCERRLSRICEVGCDQFEPELHSECTRMRSQFAKRKSYTVRISPWPMKRTVFPSSSGRVLSGLEPMCSPTSMDAPILIGHCRLIGELQRCPYMALCKLPSTNRICDLSCCGLRADWIQLGARLDPDWTRIAPGLAANLPSEGPMQFGPNLVSGTFKNTS